MSLAENKGECPLRTRNPHSHGKLCLDLCCGKGGGTQAFRDKPEWHILGIDNNPKMEQFWHGSNVEFACMDVTTIPWEDFKDLCQRKGFERVEFLWASPPCTHFSLACLQFPRKGIMKSLEIVGACLEAVDILKPKYWLVENPRGRLRRFLGKPRQTIRYSDYELSMKMMKTTDLWGNLELPMVPHERRIQMTSNMTGIERLHHNFPAPHIKGIDSDMLQAERAFVPLGVSEAVYQAVTKEASV